MRGALFAALVLVGLDVVLNSPGSRVAALMTVPTRWLAEWMDPSRPLIAQPAAPASSPGGPPPLGSPGNPTQAEQAHLGLPPRAQTNAAAANG